MLNVKWIVALLRVLLVLAFVFLLVMEFFSIPGDILHDLGQAPEAAHLLLPMLVVAELVMICFQIVLVCIWVLLTMVRKDRIFSDASLRWVDGIVWSFVAAWVFFAGLAVYLTAYLYLTPELRDPGLPLLLFGLTLAGAVVVLLMLVMRALLRQATTLRTDMEEVI
ncbi:DUF2975 domain-containing protein [Lysobacter korlensis]|uniref:DUF2975 domain-containing protein n=1 Tax=Lysobacter korlensis TaxID=553636 RepID=A0ABV6RWK4_9GAMM